MVVFRLKNDAINILSQRCFHHSGYCEHGFIRSDNGAPANILVGCSTVGLAGKEAPVLKVTLKYGLDITAIIGLATSAVIWLGLKG